jgi:hypothetical protein
MSRVKIIHGMEDKWKRYFKIETRFKEKIYNLGSLN